MLLLDIIKGIEAQNIDEIKHLIKLTLSNATKTEINEFIKEYKNNGRVEICETGNDRNKVRMYVSEYPEGTCSFQCLVGIR